MHEERARRRHVISGTRRGEVEAGVYLAGHEVPFYVARRTYQ
jgi:hypothetical protein